MSHVERLARGRPTSTAVVGKSNRKEIPNTQADIGLIRVPPQAIEKIVNYCACKVRCSIQSPSFRGAPSAELFEGLA